MENILHIIAILEEVVLILFLVSFFRYVKKETKLSLMGYIVSSVCMCTLGIIGLLIKNKLNRCYATNIFLIVAYVINFFKGIFYMRSKLRIIETDENESNEEK